MVTLSVFCGVVRAGEGDRVFPGRTWAVKSPAEAGLDAAKLKAFASSVGADDPNAGSCGCIIRNGYLVYSWGVQTEQVNWASSSKPVFSTLLLFAIADGKLKGVDDKVGDWGWQFSEKDRLITFYNLANNTSGYACQEAPGEAWCYNDTAIQLYYLTLQKVFGKDINAAGLECLGPLQFQDGSLFNEKGRLVTTPRDFARICWFWANRGHWGGKQLLPREYFDKYMKPQVPDTMPLSVTRKAEDYLGIGSYGGKPKAPEYGPGKYGFNWWFNVPDRGSKVPCLPDVPADTVITFGSRGCNSVTIPSLGLVVTGRGRWGSFDSGRPQSPSATAPSTQEIAPRRGGYGRERLNANLKLLVEAVQSSPVPDKLR
jgi:CubicO group peptidase (beta-lactamase class C family)